MFHDAVPQYVQHRLQCSDHLLLVFIVCIWHWGLAGSCQNTAFCILREYIVRQTILPFILWLALWAGKMDQMLCCDCLPKQARWSYLSHLELPTVSRKKNFRKPYNKSFIDQAWSVKMAWYWPCSFFVILWTSSLSQSINMQTKNLANIQPSWPHTWSITHFYVDQPPSLTVNFSFFGCIFLGKLHTTAKISDSSQWTSHHKTHLFGWLKFSKHVKYYCSQLALVPFE